MLENLQATQAFEHQWIALPVIRKIRYTGRKGARESTIYCSIFIPCDLRKSCAVLLNVLEYGHCFYPLCKCCEILLFFSALPTKQQLIALCTQSIYSSHNLIKILLSNIIICVVSFVTDYWACIGLPLLSSSFKKIPFIVLFTLLAQTWPRIIQYHKMRSGGPRGTRNKRILQQALIQELTMMLYS